MDSRGSSRPSSRQSCQSTASRPQSTVELLAYVNKANQTIKLLQEELHTTSQFAIKLTQKYEAKRAERDQVLQQLQLQRRQSHKQMCQLQLLCNYLAQDRQPREMPAAVAAVVVEHATLRTAGGSQQADQLPAAWAARAAEQQQQQDTPRQFQPAATTKQAQQQICNLPSSRQVARPAAETLSVATPSARATASSAAATDAVDNVVRTLSGSPGLGAAVSMQQSGATSTRSRDGGRSSSASLSSRTPSRAPSSCQPGSAIEQAVAGVANSNPGWMAALQPSSFHRDDKQQHHELQQSSQMREQVQQYKPIQLSNTPTSRAAPPGRRGNAGSATGAQQRTKLLVKSNAENTAGAGHCSSPPGSSRLLSMPFESDTAAGNSSAPSPGPPVALAKDGRSPASDGNSNDTSSSSSNDTTTDSHGADSSGGHNSSADDASETCTSAPSVRRAGRSMSSVAPIGTGTGSINSSRKASCALEHGRDGAGSGGSRSLLHSSRTHEHLQQSSRSDASSQRRAKERQRACNAAPVRGSHNPASTIEVNASSPVAQAQQKQQESTSTSSKQQFQWSPAPAAAEATCAVSHLQASPEGTLQLAATAQHSPSSTSLRQQSHWFPAPAAAAKVEPSSPPSPSLASPCSSGFQSVASIGQDRNSSCRSSFSSMVSACSRSTRASQGSLSAAVSSAWIEQDETPNSLAPAATVSPKARANAGNGCARASRSSSRPSSRSELHASSLMTCSDTRRSYEQQNAADAAAAASTAAGQCQSPVSWPDTGCSHRSAKAAAAESTADTCSDSSSPKSGRKSRKGKIVAASSCRAYRAAQAAAAVRDPPGSPCNSTAVRGSAQQQQGKAEQRQHLTGADVSSSAATPAAYSSSQQVLTRSSSEARSEAGSDENQDSNSSSSSSEASIRDGSPTEVCRNVTAVVESSMAAAANCSFSTWNTAKSASPAEAQPHQQLQPTFTALPQLDDSILGGFHAGNAQSGQGGGVRGRRRAAATIRQGQAHRQQQIPTTQQQNSQYVFGQVDDKIDQVEMAVGQVGDAVVEPVDHSSSDCAVGSSSSSGRDSNASASALEQSGTAGASVHAGPANMPRRVPGLRRRFEQLAPKEGSIHKHRRSSCSTCSSGDSSSCSSSEGESASDDDDSFEDADEGSSTRCSSSADGGSSRNSSSAGAAISEASRPVSAAGVAATPGTVSRSNSFGLSLGGLLHSLAAVGGAAAAAMSDRLSPGRTKSRPGLPPWASSGGAAELPAAIPDRRQASSSTPGAPAASVVTRGPMTGRSPLGSPARQLSPLAAAAAVDPAANLPSDLDDDSSSSDKAVDRLSGSNCSSGIDSFDLDRGSAEDGSGHTESDAVGANATASDDKDSSTEDNSGSELGNGSDDVSEGSSSSNDGNEENAATGCNQFDLLQCSDDSEIQEDSSSEGTSEI